MTGEAGSQRVKLSIIIPVLNERENIAGALSALAALRARGAEVIVVDGGSDDGTVEIAAVGADRLIVAARGRATQQNAGAERASGDVFLFLHSDTRLPLDADILIEQAFADAACHWGRFDVCFDVDTTMFRVIAAMMNARSRLTGVTTGDQCLFVRASAFAAAGGFPAIALMEDIALSKLLRRQSAPACLRATVTTSARRWQTRGVWRTIVLMWWLRLAYVLGVPTERLARWYNKG